MSHTSIKVRFFASVGANILRAMISFSTGLLVARGLTPVGYGDLAYLLGSFLAVKALIDMGSGSAFFTFISQQARGRNFYLMYYAWLLMQFTATVLLVAMLMPQQLIDQIWLGNSREVILLALLASFMQQQVWTTVTQLAESTRQTVKVQLLGLSVVATHAVVVMILYFGGWLSVIAVLLAIIAEYILATIISTRLLSGVRHDSPSVQETSTSDVLNEYWKYCRPLILLAIVSFLYEFADRWMLQKYGGATQQGFYQISAQLAAVCLLATTSILNIFWKEISEANARQDKERVALLYNKVNRGLIALGAVISCFLIPWAEEIVMLLLGSSYQQSWPIFAVMLIYPIHQSMGQVNATMFFACTHTKTYTLISITGQVISIPITYLLLASDTETLIPGLALGAFGLAIKMVGMNILLVNMQAWLIARLNGWKYEWGYQVIGIGTVLALSYLVKQFICYFIPEGELATNSRFLISVLLLSGMIYIAGVTTMLWHFSTVAGIDKAELRAFVNKYNPFNKMFA